MGEQVQFIKVTLGPSNSPLSQARPGTNGSKKRRKKGEERESQCEKMVAYATGDFETLPRPPPSPLRFKCRTSSSPQ
ncbi:unnamed protein product [Arctogadus glacialis]